ncbi:MAG: TonB-dependent siderophore receptor [Nostoc sp.]|uniref:TonB-dependent siderophore receptor n=1 Tax=Nostoc sp. TaxID=1180 RepID=UPI002FFC8EFB
MALEKLSIWFWQCVLLTASIITSIHPVLAQQIANATSRQLSLQQTAANEILNLSDVQSALKSATSLLRTPRQQNSVSELTQALTPVVSVTDVKVNATNKGIEVILVTPNSEKLFVSERTEGNSYVAEIKNAQLQLASGNFRQQKPAAGIANIIVVPVDGNTLRLTVTGETALPVVELFDSQTEGLVFGVTPSATTAQQPTPSQQTKPSESNQPPIELEVTAPPETSYNVNNASIGTRTNTPTRDVPQVINVIPQQVFKDQRVLNVGDALKNAGISQGGLPSSLQDRFVIRGFDASFGNILIDGQRSFFVAAGDAFNINNVDRIEVLRGPASVLYGQGNLGGIINLVTKQPLTDPYYAASFSVGSYNTYQGTLDLSAPLTSDKKVLYRLNGSYLTSDSFVDFYHQKRYQIAGALSWDITKDTKLTLNSSYEDFNRSISWQGLPALGTIYLNPNGKLPRSRFLGEPGQEDPQDTTNTRLSYKLEHRFNDNWSLENGFQYIIRKGTQSPGYSPISLQSDNRTLNRIEVSFLTPSLQNFYDLNTQVTGRFNTGGIEHQLVFGTQYSWNNSYQSQEVLSAPSIDIFNPIYGQPGGGTLLSKFQGGLRVDDLGVYAQDIIRLSENLKLVLGGRYDWSGRTDFNRFANSPSTSISSQAFSPRAGLVYQPIKPISLYASYSRSFEPQTGLSASGQPFEPVRGTQYEVGVKADLLSDKLSANLALYNLTLSNNLTTDPNNDRFSIPVGEQRSRGVELFVTGEILLGWNVIASYAYTDPRVTDDNNIPVGNLLALAPQNQASLWTTYIIPKGNLKGLGVGLGLFYVGDRQGNLANTFELPSYVRTDAAVYYRRGQFDGALNFQNLFDIRYIDTAFANNNTRVFYGSPFTVNFTLGWHF